MADGRQAGGMPWWTWLIVAVAAIAILWLLFARGDRDDAPVGEPGVEAPAEAEGGFIGTEDDPLNAAVLNEGAPLGVQ